MASLEWSVRRSLLSYIADLDDGVVRVDGGASSTADGFVFPRDPSAGGDDLHFRGSVTLSAYEGALTLPVVDPRIEPADDIWHLTIVTPDAIATPDADDSVRRIRLATIARLEPDSDGALTGSGVALASPGSMLFTFGPYVAGTPLDDLRITR